MAAATSRSGRVRVPFAPMHGDRLQGRGLCQELHPTQALLGGRDAQSQSDGNRHVDWTQLPDACRLLIVRLMDRATRSEWAAVCQVTRQDVHADASALTWSGCGQWQMHESPLPQTSPRDPSFTTTLPAGLHARLPYLKHLNCSGMPQLTSIQGIPPTLRSLDLSFCHHLDDVAALQHCTALEQLTLTGHMQARQGLAATLPPAMSAISPHLRRLKLQVFERASDAVAEAVVRSLEALTGLHELSLHMAPASDIAFLRKRLARAVTCMTDLRVLALTYPDGCIQKPASAITRYTFNELAPAIAHLARLQSLDLSGVVLHRASAGAAAALAQPWSSLPATLTRMDLTGALIDPSGATALVPFLQAHSATLRSVSLSFKLYKTGDIYPLGADGLADLLPGLRCCSALTDVDLAGGLICADNGIADGGAVLAAALAACAPRLTSLDLSSNCIGDKGAASLATVLSCTTALGKLGLRNNKLGPVGAASLAKALSSACPPVTSLDISASHLCNKGLTALAPGLLSIGPSLTSLNLSGNLMNFDGASALVPAVKSMTALVTLECEKNELAAAALAPALLSIAPSLTSLNISHNSLRSAGAMLLAPALRRMTALVALAYQDNRLGSDLTRLAPTSAWWLSSEGPENLAPALSSIAPSLTSLDFSHNMLGDKDAEVLAPALSRMTALATLDLGGNALGLADAAALSPALLSIAPSLKSLDLSDNAMDASSVAALAPALRNLTALERLSFFKNNIDLAGTEALSSALPMMVKLKHLDLGRNRLGLEGLRALARGLETLSGQQRWCVSHLTQPLWTQLWWTGTAEYDSEDAAELAAAVDVLKCLKFVCKWETRAKCCKTLVPPDELKVTGVTVDL